MKKLLLTWLFFLIATFVNAQVVMGSGVAQGGTLPLDVSYNYNYTQQIFTKAEINAASAGNITGMKFYLPSGSSITNSKDWTVYLGHTTKAAFSSTSDWFAVADLTQVFSGSLSVVGGEVTVNFSTPFNYNNTNNLVVAIHENTPDKDGTLNRFYTYTGSSNTSLYYRSDTVVPDVVAPPTGNRATTKSIVSLLGLTPLAVPACPVISAPTAGATTVSTLPTITWGLTTGAASYTISLGTTAGGTDILNNVNVGNVLNYTLTTSLNFGTQYYLTVKGVNSVGESVSCTERSFTTTATLGCPSVGNLATDLTGASVRPTFTWSAATGGALGYRINIGTTAGGTDILNNHDVGNVLTYTLPASNTLSPNTKYYYTINAYNGAVSSASCTERNFTTTTAPLPSNDECSGAITLTVNPDMSCAVKTSGTTLGASKSSDDTSCNGNADDDVWYKFTATSSTHIFTFSNIVSLGSTSSTDIYTQILSGTCGSLVSVNCSDTDGTTIVNNLVPGQEYYVRIYSYYASGYSMSFDFCVGTLPAAPTNDECANAVTLPVNPDLSCTNTVAGTTLAATDSNVAVSPCTGTADDDVWYKFTATSTAHTLWLKNVTAVGTSTSTSLYTQVFSGDCGTLVSKQCITSNTNFSTLSGLTVGDTYYVRVYNNNANSATTIYGNTFDICIGTPPPPPANDECTDAVTVTVNPDMSCTSVVSGTTYYATNSGLAVSPCSGTADDDVWYKFVATNATHTIQLKNIVSVGSSSSTSLYTQVFSGACGGLTSIKCITSNANFTLLSGLTPGDTYYVRVYNSSANTATNTYANTFDLCIGTLPAAPVNDECADAVNILVNSDLNCGSMVSGTTLSATNSGLAVSPCSGTADDDVWFKFTAVSAVHTLWLKNIVSVGTASSTSLYTQVFEGACGALTSKLCITSNTAHTLMTGLTPGVTYYVRVYNSNSNSATAIYANTFDICIGTPPPPPSNDDCVNAITLIANSTDDCTNSVTMSTASATASTETAPTCSASGINDDVWFKFVATNIKHVVSTIYSDNATTTQVYSGTCGSLVAMSCFAGGYTNSNVLLDNLTVGETYYVRVFSTTSTTTTNSTFTICVTTPQASTNISCDTAITIPCGGTITGYNTGAPDVTLPSTTCGSTTNAINKGVWYAVTAAVDGDITISTCGSEFDTYLRVYEGCGGTMTCEGNADSGCSGTNTSNAASVTFAATAGTTYYALVTGYNANQFGKFNISVTQQCTGLGVNENIKRDEAIKAYPNPFADVLNISDVKNVKSIAIVDMAGRVAKTFEKPESSLQLADLKSGMYLVVLNMKDGSRQTIKAIKK